MATLRGRLNRRAFVGLGVSAAGMLALGGCGALPGGTRTRAPIPRVGYFTTGTRGSNVAGPRADAFLDGLREFGLIDGETIAIGWRFTGDRPDVPLAMLAQELVALPVR